MIGAKNDAGLTARVTAAFIGAPDGEAYPRPFRPGDIIRGALALAEVEAGRAEWTAPPDLERKEPAGPFPTGAATSSSSARRGRAKGKTTSKRRAVKRA